MKIITALTALGIVVSGAAAVASPAAPAAPTATPVKHPSLKVCNKQADAKKLTGPDRARFVKDCRGGKTS